MLSFVKVEGLGNDFLLLDLRAQGELGEATIAALRARAPQLCDRRRGVGADGLLLVGAGAAGQARMVVVNFDGSRPEMCGNGLRCVAGYVAASAGLGVGAELSIETDVGLLRCAIDQLDPGSAEAPRFRAEVEVDMGPARRLGSEVPAAGEGREFAGVSMGNPHAVYFVASGEEPEALARRLGPGVELDPAYQPARTNVELARVDGAGWIELWVWERGVGITEACGTGACATAVAAVDAGLIEAGAPVEVRLPGGVLIITVPADPSRGVSMAGPARAVFHGRV